MKDRFDDNSLMKMEDKMLDLKYEKKILKNEKKHTIIKLVLDILRPFGLAALNLYPIALYIWFSIFAGTNGWLGLGVAPSFFIYLFPAGILYGIQATILSSIDDALTGGELIFVNPRFDKIANDIKYLQNVNSKIKSKNSEISLLTDVSKNVVLTEDQKQRFTEKRREELIQLIDKEYLNLENSNPNEYELVNYYPKTNMDDLKYIKKVLLKHKKIEKDKEYQKEKQKVKEKIIDKLYY